MACLSRCNRVAQFNRVVDAGELLDPGTGSANVDRPIAEDAAKDRLIDDYRFDLIDVHLVGMPGDEAALVDNAVARHGNLRCEGMPPGANAHDDGAAQQQRRGGVERQLIIGIFEMDAGAARDCCKNEKSYGRPIDDPMQAADDQEFFIRLQYVLYVAHALAVRNREVF